MTMAHREYRHQLFSVIVRSTSIIVLVGTVANSYYLLTDFARTLVQTTMGLAVVAGTLVCLRLAQRGHMRLGVAIYLSSGMLMSTTLLVVNSKPFILFGALGLSLFVLVATFLEPSGRSLRWGILAILLFVAGVTIRMVGPFEPLALDETNLLTFYIGPALALLGFTMLGRGATGRLVRALDESEVARKELSQGNTALQAIQRALQAANQQLHTELAERERAEKALRQSLEETASGHRLLLALSQGAEAMQAARTEEEVYRSITNSLVALKRDSIVLKLVEAGSQLEIAYFTHDLGTLDNLQELTGFPVPNYRFPLKPDGLFQQVIAGDKTIVSDRASDYLAEALPSASAEMASLITAALGARRTIFAPLKAGKDVHGILAAGAYGLSQAELDAVSTFTNQAAITLSNLQLLQQVQDWAAELESRVEERTAELAMSEERYRGLFDSNRDGLFVLDTQGNCIDVNSAGAELLGYSREELVVLDVFGLADQWRQLAPSQRKQSMQKVWQAMRGGDFRIETDVDSKCSGQIPVEIMATALSFGGDECILASARNITERKQAENDLRASQTRMQKLAHQVISTQEEERRKLAHALHDEAGQALTALKITLELIAQDLPGQHKGLQSRIQGAAGLAESTMNRLRQLAQGLRPPALDSVGLGPTLEDCCHDFATWTHLSIDYRGQDPPLLPEPVSITLYRFLQEALTNVARHAAASQVRVILDHDAESVALSVQDDGHGFGGSTARASGPSPGIGLVGMRERLESLGGTLDVESSPETGTRVAAWIPLESY